MLISEISRVNSGNGIEFLRTTLEHSPLLRSLQFRPGKSDFLHYPVGAVNEPDFRARNAAPSSQNVAPTPVARQLAHLSKDMPIDKTYVLDALAGNLDIRQYQRAELAQEAIKLASKFDKAFIGGTGTGQNTGLSTKLSGSAISEFGSETCVVDASATLLDLTSSSNNETFLKLVDSTLYQTPNANMILCNRTLAGVFTSIARSTNSFSWSIDQFGQRVAVWNGITIIPLADGAIANTEASGGGSPTNNTTSMYVLRSAEYGGVVADSNTGLMYTDFPMELEATAQMKARYELYFETLIDTADSIRRIRRIKAV